MSDEWMKIDSAPIDERILLWVEGGGHDGKGDHVFGRVVMRSTGRAARPEGYTGNWTVNVWRPLPEPPVSPAKEGSPE